VRPVTPDAALLDGEVTGHEGRPVWRFRILDGALPA